MSQAAISSNTTALQPAPRPAAHNSAWAFAAVLIVMLLIVGLPLAYMAVRWTNTVSSAPAKVGEALSQFAASAIQPRETVNQIVLSSINDLHKESKLVVFTTVISTDVTREEGDSTGYMYWGTNVARVAIKDARVQYVIDLSKIQTSDFQYNDSAKVMTLFVPRPRIDTQMVSIDPAKIQTLDLRGGWLRWDKQSTRDNAIAELRPKIITQAQTPYVQDMARDAGLEQTTKFLQPVADALAKDGAAVRVSYRD